MGNVIRLVNATGASVGLSPSGARIVSVVVPDTSGRLAEIVVSDITYDRVRNRTQKLGSVIDFVNRIWTAERKEENSVMFSCESDIEYGATAVSLAYVWTDDNTLELYLNATPDDKKKVIEAITAPTFFNLGEPGDGLLADQTIYLNAADRRLIEKNPCPVGALPTPSRFRIGDWEKDTMSEAVVLADHRSGRQLNVYTSLPWVCIRKNGAGVAISCEGLSTDASRQLIFYEFKLM